MTSRGGRLLRLALLVAAILVGAAPAASAHNSLERSDPPNLGKVAVGRTVLTLWFGEPVNARASSFSVQRTDPQPAPVPASVKVEPDGSAVHLTVPALQRGMYRIRWSVVAEDGHPTSGTVTFGVGVRPVGGASQATIAPSPWLLGVRLTDLGGLLVAIGAVAVSGRVLRALRVTGRALFPRVLRLGVAGAVVSVVATGVTPLLRVHDQLAWTGEGWSAWPGALRDLLVDSTFGPLWLLRLGAGTLAVLALRWAAHGGPDAASPRARRTDPLIVAAWALVASAGLDAWAGHASTLPARTPLAVLAATLHVVASGVWVGGLLVLLVALRPLTRLDPVSRRGLAPAAWRAFSPMAAVAAGVLAATGVYLAGRQVQTLSTVTRSAYGTAVVVKALLLAVALAVAAYTTLVVNPSLADRLLGARVAWRPAPRRISPTIVAELAVLATAVAVAALMTTVPTAREVSRADALSAPVSRTVDGVFVTFEAVQTGSAQHLVVRTEPVVRPIDAPVTGVEVAVDARGTRPAGAAPLRVQLVETEAGRYEGNVTDAEPGDWAANVVLHRTARPDSVLGVSWSSSSADAVTPLERTSSALAVLLLAGIGSVLALVVARRRRGGQDGGQGPNGDGRLVTETTSGTDTLARPRAEATSR